MELATRHGAKTTPPPEYNRQKRSSFYDPCSCQMSDAFFDTANMRESGQSSTSGSIVRQRAVALAIILVVESAATGKRLYRSRWRDALHQNGTNMCIGNMQPSSGYSVYNTEAHGLVHEILSRKVARYTASEYVSPTATPGSTYTTRVGKVRHEDLRNLSFPSDSFDLVLSTEVLEHIPDPYLALSEVLRVLKPGGTYLWTVPMSSDTHSRDAQLSVLSKAGKRFDAAEPVSNVEGRPTWKAPQFHGDPLSPEGGIVVFQIFGAGELLPRMCEIGFEETRVRNIYSPAYGIVTPGGVTLMLAKKPKSQAATGHARRRRAP